MAHVPLYGVRLYARERGMSVHSDLCKNAKKSTSFSGSLHIPIQNENKRLVIQEKLSELSLDRNLQFHINEIFPLTCKSNTEVIFSKHYVTTSDLFFVDSMKTKKHHRLIK